jgi:hypothetical protein
MTVNNIHQKLLDIVDAFSYEIGVRCPKTHIF